MDLEDIEIRNDSCTIHVSFHAKTRSWDELSVCDGMMQAFSLRAVWFQDFSKFVQLQGGTIALCKAIANAAITFPSLTFLKAMSGGFNPSQRCLLVDRHEDR